MVIAELTDLKERVPSGYWSSRIIAQLEYATKLSGLRNGEHDELILSIVRYLSQCYAKDSAITKDAALQAERMLSRLSDEAKRFKIICAAHAHIDMNWMWRWDETVAVALDTFRTMLDLMNEYPQFKFSQSQASVYRIVEEYAPDMLEEIKARVKEGRWEVTASTWVETDKNMPSGESLARHILYTKKYLSALLGIDANSLNIDFEPDTFGHSVNVPEILVKGGVRYYYHCRGYEGYYMYRWKAPSGNSVLVYREPLWYNGQIEPSMALYVPEFCHKHHMDTMLKVYGVGDHGGGPTRRDIERIIDMSAWPVFPEIRFGTFGEYFALMDRVADELPVVEGELNFIFTGCYTTQTRIKMANRIAEATLNEAEAFNTIAALYEASKYSTDDFAKAWENVLFNQFHDIIPGSGVIDTREYAMGLFQKIMAIANTKRSFSMRAIASKIDTSSLIREANDLNESTSEGAGVGFGVKEFRVTQCERGRGKDRIFHVFNAAPYARKEAVEIIVWDWHGDVDRILFKDSQGNAVAHQLLDHGVNRYWGHEYIRVLVKADVPACGYSTYVMTEMPSERLRIALPHDPRTHKPDEFKLENDFIKVVFDVKDASIISLFDKCRGQELIDPSRPAGIFRLIEEDPSRGMTAWVVGRYMNIKALTENVKIKRMDYKGDSIRQSIAYEIAFGNSTLKVVVSLDHDKPGLRYDVECHWREIGKAGQSVPQLGFYMPLGYRCSRYRFDVPFGTIERNGMDIDVPANSWAAGIPDNVEQSAVMLVSDSKYGFRCVDHSIAMTLIRSSFDPDPYPEFGVHRFAFGIYVAEDLANANLIRQAYNFNHPLNATSSIPHTGVLPANKGFVELVEGTAVLSAIKMPETGSDTNAMILRLYEVDGANTTVVLRFFQDVKRAYFVDINEDRFKDSAAVAIEGGTVRFDVPTFSVASICVEF